MKSDNATMLRTCPLCGAVYGEHPAMSRNYPNTAICPDCGTREALQSIGVNTAEHYPPKYRQINYTIPC